MGLIAVAGLIVAAVAFAISPTDVRAGVCRGVSSILQTDLGCASGAGGQEGAAPEDSDFEPEKCTVHKQGEKTSSVIKIGFVEIGENAGFVVTEYSDGSVTMTATNGGSLGATGGVGADASWGSAKAGARVDFGGGVEFDYGSTWTFEDKGQAEQFREQLDDYLYDQWAMTHPACGAGVCMPRPTTGAEPPPVPSTSFSGVKVNAEVNGELGISATGGKAPMTQAEMTTQGVVASINPSGNWVTTSDNKGTADDESDDTRTYVTDLQLNSEITHQIGLDTGGGGSVQGMSLAITKDAEGRITEVKITSTVEVTESGGSTAGGEAGKGGEGQGKKSGGAGISAGSTEGDVVVEETTLSVDPENVEEQETVTDWLGGTGDHEWPGVLPMNALDPSHADPDSPFGQMLFDQATNTSIAYDKVSDVQQFGLNVKFGLALGADFSMASEETTATEATYLGAPRPDGTRPVLDYSSCVG